MPTATDLHDDAGAHPAPASRATIGDRIAAFVMLDGMKDATQAQKCLRLHLIGFAHAEIASMLQTTVGTVSQNIYAERKKQTATKKTTRKKAPKKASNEA